MDYTKAIQDELKSSNGDVRKAARRLGFNVQAAEARFSETTPSEFENLGRPELRKYIVAYRHVARDWPYDMREALRNARRKFDAGTHEMCQGREGAIIIQYLIPRMVPCKPRKFFSYEDQYGY